MTVRAWLRERTPAPPERLLQRVEAVLGGRCDAAASNAYQVCLEATDELLRDVLARASAGRESALDLLTVDALVTYAFEAATASPEMLGDRALDAMARLAEFVRT